MYSKMGHALTKKKSKKNKQNLKFDPKEEYFIKNGGILLEKQIALHQGSNIEAGQVKILSSYDIQKATNSYDSDLVLGNTTSVTVYKGFLDNLTVAIKSCSSELDTNSKLRDLILTEASAGMVINHPNMVKLYGCCLETCIPILVYEFMSRGGLLEYFHGKFASNRSFYWVERVRVLADVSYALSYMHNALSKPVVHRDVQSNAILLEDSYHAKLSNLGYSVVITPGDKSQKWPVVGTPGYIDPEYIETQEVTDKCDVYSFGVLMLELLTRRQPHIMAKEGNDLVDEFASLVRRNCIEEMLDKQVLEKGRWDEIEMVVELAVKCVRKKAIERPTMVEVVSKLWEIQAQHIL